MKEIPLTKGKIAIIDDVDFERFGHLKWTTTTNSAKKRFYAYRGEPRPKKGHILMHRAIMGIINPHIKVDHMNHNTLDNRRGNLRICTQAQNVAHRGVLDQRNTSGLRGVSWHKQREKWRARIMVDQKEIHLGLFKDKKSAAASYASANHKYFGSFGGVIS